MQFGILEGIFISIAYQPTISALTQRSSKIQSFYQMLDMELGIFFDQILFYEVKIPSDEKFSNLDHSKRLWLSLKLVEI